MGWETVALVLAREMVALAAVGVVVGALAAVGVVGGALGTDHQEVTAKRQASRAWCANQSVDRDMRFRST